MIAVLDSGSGGANVIKECLKYYNQDFIYLIDNKNCPYGDKSPERVKQIILDNIEYLQKNYSIDFIILGCNTASSLLNYFDLENIKCPILKTYPDLKNITRKDGVKLLFATKNTIENSTYVKYYLLNYNDLKTIYVKDLPKLIDIKFSSNDEKNEKNIEKILKKHLFFNKKIKNKYKNVKNIALGCTHFKHIQTEILDCFQNAKIFNCENNVAKISKMLIKKNKDKSSIKVMLTQNDEKLKQAIENFLDIK